MKKITEKELGAYNELLVQEKATMEKFNYYAQNCKDPQLKKLCKEAAARHQEHYNIIFAQIQQGDYMANYDDKTMMTDMLASQKFIAQNYNNYAGECSTKQSKAKLMKILGEEHDIQFKIFEQMNAKGWYPTTPAPQDKINEAVQQHIQGATNITKTAAKAKKSNTKLEKSTEKKTEKSTAKKAK